MIIGTGIDITEISRIKKLADTTDFLNRFFTDEELCYLNERKNNPETIAGSFAAKEAFSKALGTGISGFSLKDISVLRNDVGAPYIKLYQKASDLFSKLGGKKIFVSISHDGGFAIANVIIEGDDIR